VRLSIILVLVVAVAALVAPTAAAKMLPTFEQTTAAPGDRVGVRIVGASYYLAPLRFYLVSTSAAPRLHGQSDPRLKRIAVLDGPRHVVSKERFSFRVPQLVPGAYVISVWFRSTLSPHRWTGFTPWNSFPPGVRERYELQIG
jgi:hypothetical protein